ncbi:MinD/ParA family protein [Thalassorhabdus alkalitolerans]|uniref:MinD/ParA family protein n=1 Tax=Thalassorhabdus alkalitolerans TaxID=2282697 RepID=A0ABW0YI88_9BACI
MNDQAESLRKLMNSRAERRETHIISVVSGKGGVGKTNVSVNFSIALAQKGKKVVLFDMDIGMANVDILLGTHAAFNVRDMIERELSVWDIINEGPSGVYFAAGGSGLSDIFSLTEGKKKRFLHQIEMLNGHFDYIIFDLGAGVSKNSMQFVLASHEVFLVTTPEPTSITDAYSMIKHITACDQNLPLFLIVNRAFYLSEGKKAGENLQKVSKRFLHKELAVLGLLPDDDAVRKAVYKQIPYSLAFPRAKVTGAIRNACNKYLDESEREPRKPFYSFISKLKGFMSSPS